MINFRKLEYDDLPFLNEVRNICCEEYLHDSRKFTLLETKVWYLRHKPDYYIILNENQKIGYFRLSHYSEINANMYLGADLHPEYRSKGLGYESYKKFMPFAFKEYNLNKITLEVLVNNNAAISLYKKLGFVTEGIKRQEVKKGNIFVDSQIMSILKSEFEKIYEGL